MNQALAGWRGHARCRHSPLHAGGTCPPAPLPIRSEKGLPFEHRSEVLLLFDTEKRFVSTKRKDMRRKRRPGGVLARERCCAPHLKKETNKE
eukprot:8002892-Pyramimonas_sp.AAC.1